MNPLKELTGSSQRASLFMKRLREKVFTTELDSTKERCHK